MWGKMPEAARGVARGRSAVGRHTRRVRGRCRAAGGKSRRRACVGAPSVLFRAVPRLGRQKTSVGNGVTPVPLRWGDPPWRQWLPGCKHSAHASVSRSAPCRAPAMPAGRRGRTLPPLGPPWEPRGPERPGRRRPKPTGTKKRRPLRTGAFHGESRRRRYPFAAARSPEPLRGRANRNYVC